MSRRKQCLPKKSDNLGEEESAEDRPTAEQGSEERSAETGGQPADSSQMPILEEASNKVRSPSPPPSSPPRMTSPPLIKMKQPEDLLKNPDQDKPSSPLDLLKSSPFLLPAQLLAMNPQLYAAQLAQLQAAQILLAKQTQQSAENGDLSRKRPADPESPLDLGSKQKQARSSSPSFPAPRPERPLDLSGCKSPDSKPEGVAAGYFNPLMPAGLLSFFNQLRPADTPTPSSVPGFPAPKTPSPPATRNPWQSQWARGTEAQKVEDVFKCVWCKESYHTLEALTRHMKEAKHHTMSPYPMPLSSPLRAPVPAVSSPMMPSVSISSSLATPPRPSPPSRDILKEQLPLPRKLVRGQDVWIGRADEQTRDILKCMGCGQSFRSLDLLTKHMQETQHYKKVISHDQISAWKYPETQSSAKNHVNSVLSCKVCDKGFGSLKELSDHMVRANHYAGEPKFPRSVPLHQPLPTAQPSKERKKALPVKKLLELERARQEVAGNTAPISAKEILETGKLLCERCEEKIPIDVFIPHIQQCVGKPRFLKTETVPSTSSEPRKDEAKLEGKESNSSDSGSPSILGSLEQLVKGNFPVTTGARSVPLAAPVTSLPVSQTSPIGKFNISSLFPASSKPSPSVSPSQSSPSKPASPSSSRSGSLLHPSLEKMLDSPIEQQQPNGSPRSLPADEARTSNGRNSPAPSDASDDEKNTQHEKESPSEAKSDDHSSPLAALQMLCEDQKKTPRSQVKQTSASPMSDPGAILAFSWACNQAVSGDSAIKCPFCDTPFISKGAYRHHLSKMHFTKENLGSLTGGPPRTPSPEGKDAEESLQSKYHKYSQLAKQLSCYDGNN